MLDMTGQIISKQIDTEFSGDNKYQSYRKNYVTFLKHLKVIDSEGELTDSGFKLYHLGLVNGASSKIFQDYFIKEVLMILNDTLFYRYYNVHKFLKAIHLTILQKNVEQNLIFHKSLLNQFQINLLL